MTTAAQYFAEWMGAPGSCGVTDDLRCVAMCCQDDGLPVRDYVAAGIALGYHEGTLRNRWSEVKRQNK